MDLGQPVSYEVVSHGTPIYSADGQQIGRVGRVLAVEAEDVFDGIVIDEHVFGEGRRFADADDVAAIYEQGVVLKLDREACGRLPPPSANPAVMRADPAESHVGGWRAWLGRTWDRLSGKG